jgi:hypothetical protein
MTWQGSSTHPEMSSLPSGENAVEVTGRVWPVKVLTVFLVSTS